MSNEITISQKHIENKIFNIRGIPVMLDSDLAEMYQVETKVLNQAVKRNIERFPEAFRFQLTNVEYEELIANFDQLGSRSQIVTLNKSGTKRGYNLKYLPYVFTEQGVAMLSAVLRSDMAVKVSIQIINAFVEMRKLIATHSGLLQRVDGLERKQLETEHKFEKIFKALEINTIPTQGIFFDGQIFDAYIFVNDLIKTAKKSIILMDNYIDETVLTLFSSRSKNIFCTILTKSITKKLELDVKKHNEQYPSIVIKDFDKAHDRFMIIDEKDVYHFGASLKDLGKKWFAFSKMDISALELLGKIEGLV